VPYWHADFFLTGQRLTIGPHVIDLDSCPRPRRARISQGWLGLRVWVDGRLQLQAHGMHAPEFTCDGEVLQRGVTSHVQDEALRWLTPGEEFAWAWHGTGPCELTVADRGSAGVVAGDAETTVVSPVERFALAQLQVPGGAEEVVAIGLDRGAQITDLVVTAR
jgi:hypothetical protein